MKHTKISIRHQGIRSARARVAMIVLVILLARFVPDHAFASSWNPTLLVNTESIHEIDGGDGSTSVDLQFGTSASTLKLLTTNTFQFNKSLSVVGGISGSTLTIDHQANISGALLVKSSITSRSTISGENLTFMGATSSYILGSLGIGKSGTPNTKLEVVGTISGSVLRASNMTVSGAVVYSSGNTLKQSAKGLSGQLLIAQGTSAPKWTNPVGGMIWYFDGNQAVATSKGPEITMPFGLTLSGVTLKAKGAPTGAAFIIDINKDGTTIFSTRPQLYAGGRAGGTGAVFSTTNLTLNSVLTIDIDQVGSTFAGSGITVMLKGTRKY